MVVQTQSPSNKMTPERIRQLCKKNDGYLNAALNDVLYLHFQGFEAIAGLEDYTQLKCLWLDSNAITRIQGLDNQPHLKCLFLQNNLIQRIENLSNCRGLDTLNLSHNQIRSVDNCDSAVLPVLTSLDLSHNHLKTADQLTELQRCDSLSVLDLSHNRIDDVLVVKVVSGMTTLRVLTLTGNPVISMIPNYRKTMILECKSLTYLDNRPVTERDRACAAAWKRGGFKAEREEQDKWVKAANRKTKEDINRLLQKRNDRGHQPPFKLLNVDSDSDDEEEQAEQSGGNNSGAGEDGKTARNDDGEGVIPEKSLALALHQEEAFMDNLQSWKNVETVLANPHLYQTSPEYLSQFTTGTAHRPTTMGMDSGADHQGETEESQQSQSRSRGVSTTNQDQSSSDSRQKGIAELNPENGNGARKEDEDAEVSSPPLQILDEQEDKEPSNCDAVLDAEEPRSTPEEQKPENEEENEERPVEEEVAESVAPSTSSTSRIFPSFVQVTYPDPSTNRFPSDRRLPIEVAPKYAALPETKRGKDCPELEPLFVEQPLARVVIDYEAMRRMPSDLDQLIAESEERLAAEEADSLRRHANYVREVDRIYEEAIEARDRERSAAAEARNGLLKETKAREEDMQVEDGKVTTDQEVESFSGQDDDDPKDAKLSTEPGISKPPPHPLPLPSSSSAAAPPGERNNFVVDLDKLREFNNRENPNFELDDSGSITVAPLQFSPLPPAPRTLSYPWTTSEAEELPSDLAALWDFGNRNHSVQGEAEEEKLQLPDREIHDLQHRRRGGLFQDDDEETPPWLREYLRDAQSENYKNVLDVPGVLRRVSREHLRRIREDNERIVDSIKRLYEDKSEISQMRRNLGAVKKVLMDSEAIPVQLPLPGSATATTTTTTTTDDDDNQAVAASPSGATEKFADTNGKSENGGGGEEEQKPEDCRPSSSSPVGKTKVDNATSDDNGKDKSTTTEINGGGERGKEEKEDEDAAFEAKIKALVDRVCQDDAPRQLKDIHCDAWEEFERKTFGRELGDEIDFTDSDSSPSEE